VLFGNCQHLIEITLDGSFNGTVSLESLQMKAAENHQRGGRQHNRKLQNEYQPSSFVPAPLELHRISSGSTGREET